ncbi:hypothetical protein GCM10023149_35290 [Mucilaginibacter gynuensis]|uniref:Uncharacterized protein n=1 Tax=Mucilaginibacter gynuensis TaxID=1302236 RepID=A0ABP8GUV1_9SPHI
MDIIRTIQETATWIEKVNNNFDDNLFRTAELAPQHYYYHIPDNEKEFTLDQLNSKRSKLLKDTGVALIPLEELVNYGRIMLYNASDTVVDGAPEIESAYFMDIGDAPPWDTWIATGKQLNELNLFKLHHEITDNWLIGWVPVSQYFYANQAILVSVLDNFSWPDEEHIRDEYSVIKNLFQKPDPIAEPEERIDLDKRSALMYTLTAQQRKNSKVYFDSLINKSSRKAPFWKRLLGIK